MEEVLLEVVCLSPYNLEMFSIAKVLASAKALNISKISAWTLCFSVAWLGCSLHTVSLTLHPGVIRHVSLTLGHDFPTELDAKLWV